MYTMILMMLEREVLKRGTEQRKGREKRQGQWATLQADYKQQQTVQPSLVKELH